MPYDYAKNPLRKINLKYLGPAKNPFEKLFLRETKSINTLKIYKAKREKDGDNFLKLIL